MKESILIVESDPRVRSALQEALGPTGHDILAVSTASEAARLIRKRKIDLLLVDLHLSDDCGLHLVTEVRKLYGPIPIILLNGDSDEKWTCPVGTRDTDAYFTKSFDLKSLRMTALSVLEASRRRRRCRGKRRAGTAPEGPREILGESQGICDARESVGKLAPISKPVLIVGESGTGKQLFAEALHRLSPRADGPFCEENCGRFREGVLESKLFGHDKGAFTGASAAHRGLFEQADGGTLFLDEILEMDTGLQAMLLKVLETGRFRRVGGEGEIQTDVRVVAATNRDPALAFREEKLREDLFYRIMKFSLPLPPLRQRDGDVILLAESFLPRACLDLRVQPRHLTPEATKALQGYDWPGNVRQLQSVIENVALFSDGPEIGGEAVLRAIERTAAGESDGDLCPGPLAPLAEVTSWHIRRAQEAVGGDVSAAARHLGVHRASIWRKSKSDAEGPPEN